ncbi:L-iditol 2-dehydrogenase [Actinobacteria bacterium OK074]|nr:L-iditol 2-dehydrogenase [Actinobacteria bacterium OK074]
MKALVLTADRSLELTDRPDPVCTAPDDVVFRVVQTGICGTDRGVLLGKFSALTGVVMGHEAVGEVASVGPAVTTVKPGDRVIANPTLFCGLCPPCRRGELNFCLNKTGNEIGIDRDGAFAEYMRLEERFLYRIPDGMSYDRAVLVEPLACVLNNTRAAGVSADDRVVVLGGGPIGAVVALVADRLGCAVRLVEPDGFRRTALGGYFVDVPGSAVEVAPPGEVTERSADVVVDTVGSLFDQASALAADRGRIVIMGFNEQARSALRPLEILQRGLSVIGAGDYNSLVFSRAVDLARRLPLEGLITHRFALDEADAALRTICAVPGAAGAYTGLKVVIEGRTAA